MRLQDHIISRYIKCYNERDIEGLLACVTEDVICLLYTSDAADE